MPEAPQAPPDLVCEVCQDEPAVGVASVPFIPYSAAYGARCLKANAHPWWILVGNQAMMETPLESTHPDWQQMVLDTIRHLGKTREQFDAEVVEDTARQAAEAAEYERNHQDERTDGRQEHPPRP